MLEWSGAVAAGKKRKENEGYAASSRWRARLSPEERKARKLMILAGTLGRCRGYLVCARCGRTGVDRAKMLASPRP